MGRGFSRYRPAHSAHGTVYWTLVMWPFLLGRALVRLRRGGKRSLRRERPGWRRLPGASAAPSRSPKRPPPPPPPRSEEIPRVWQLEEGGVRPQWSPVPAAHPERRRDLSLRVKVARQPPGDAVALQDGSPPRP